MSYERPGFNPLTQEGPFPIEKITINDHPVYFVDPDVLLKKTTKEEVVLIDAEFPAASYAKHIHTKVRPGKNAQQEDARLYETDIQLEQGAASPSRFGHHFEYHVGRPPTYRARVFADPELPHVRFLTDWNYDGHDDIMLCDSSTDRLLVRNQHEIVPILGGLRTAGYPTHVADSGTEWSNHRRLLSAPANELVNGRSQLLFHLGSAMLAARVATAMGSYREVKELKLDDLIITPNGPMHRNPDTGEYVHTLGRESITVSEGSDQKESSQGGEKDTDDSGETGPITFDRLYGIDDVKERLAIVTLYYNHPEIAKKWQTGRPSGILLKGPAGTGKTSIVHALAHDIGATVREVKGNEIHAKYIGESQRKVMALFDEVRDAASPTILFFDEFEGLFYTTDSTEGASGAINAVAGIFKTETARIAKDNPNVLFVAATNYPDRIDPTFIRSGRFDLQVTVGLPDVSARQQIFAGLIAENEKGLLPEDIVENRATDGRFRPFDPELLDINSLSSLATMSEGMSGADIRNVLQRSLLKKALAEAKGLDVEPVSYADLQAEIKVMRRS